MAEQSTLAIRSTSRWRTLAALAGASVAVAAGLHVWWRSRRRRVFVRQLLIYPVKSCAEVSVRSARVTARGLEGDRIFQVTGPRGECCTPRNSEMAALFHIRCKLTHGVTLVLSISSAPSLEVDLQAPTTAVRAQIEGLSAAPRPDGDRETLQDYGEAAAAWLEQHAGLPAGCRLTGIGSSADYGRVMILNPKHGEPVPEGLSAPLSLADEAPLLLATEASLADLNRRLRDRGQSDVGMDRFRPNVVVAASGLRPWEEDTWKKVRIGSVTFWVWQRCARCEMTTIDRVSLQRSREPLATLGTFRKRERGALNFGVHLVPCRDALPEPALACVGQELEVLEYHHERKAEWERLFNVGKSIFERSQS